MQSEPEWPSRGDVLGEHYQRYNAGHQVDEDANKKWVAPQEHAKIHFGMSATGEEAVHQKNGRGQNRFQ